MYRSILRIISSVALLLSTEERHCSCLFHHAVSLFLSLLLFCNSCTACAAQAHALVCLSADHRSLNSCRFVCLSVWLAAFVEELAVIGALAESFERSKQSADIIFIITSPASQLVDFLFLYIFNSEKQMQVSDLGPATI